METKHSLPRAVAAPIAPCGSIEASRVASKEGWQRYWRDEHLPLRSFYDGGRSYDAIHDWISGREIRVFRTPGVDERVVGPVIEGVNELVCEIGLPDFLIDRRRNYSRASISMLDMVRAATGADGLLDGLMLKEIAAAQRWRDTARGGKPHAEIFIVDQHLAMGRENWGQAEFDGGYMIISVPLMRQRMLGFIRNIAKHEAGHLFGFDEHHDSSVDIPGYTKDNDCNMLFHAPSGSICGKCLDALKHFWKGLEEAAGARFLR